jgi:flagellar biosynthesis GTPase FlhF
MDEEGWLGLVSQMRRREREGDKVLLLVGGGGVGKTREA